MNYVVWWQPCDGQLSIYMCVMDDCRISYVLIYLICLCLSLLCHDECCFSFCMAICYFKFLLWNLGHHTSFYLLCEITCHIASLFTDTYLFTHTCCTPRIAKFRGNFCLGVCNHVYMIPIEIQIHAYIKGELSINFGVQKALNSFIPIKA